MALVDIEEHHNRCCKTLRDYTSNSPLPGDEDIVRTLWRQRESDRNALTSQNANNNIVGLLSTVGVEY